MAQKILMKKSTIPGRVPGTEDLQVGELAVNTADGRLFSKHADGAVVPLGAAPEASGGGAGSVEAVATGEIMAGCAVVLNTDGTVSRAESSVSPSVPATGGIDILDIRAAFDEVSGKLVVAYVIEGDAADNSHGYAVVGAVAGGTISFGPPVMYNPLGNMLDMETGYTQVVYVPSWGRVVIAYLSTDGGWNPDTICLVEGTVQGDHLQLGVPVVVAEPEWITAVNCVVGPSNGNIIVFLWDDGLLFVRAASFNGSSISLGPPYSESVGGFMWGGAVSWDTLNDRLIYVDSEWADNGDNMELRVRVGTLTGTSIAFGLEIFITLTCDSSLDCCFDVAAGKTIISYEDPTGQWMVVPLSLSGTTVTPGTPAALPVKGSGYRTQMTYCSAVGKVVIVGEGVVVLASAVGGSLSFGEPAEYYSNTYHMAVAVAVSGSGTLAVAYKEVYPDKTGYARAGSLTPDAILFESANLTTENFLGVASEACLDGEMATVQTVGAVAANQTGLVAGRRYYVSEGGELDLTPADPEVYAGLALSSTTLLVKG